jgi:hypothetical protein
MKFMNHSFLTDLHFAIDANFDNPYISELRELGWEISEEYVKLLKPLI